MIKRGAGLFVVFSVLLTLLALPPKVLAARNLTPPPSLSGLENVYANLVTSILGFVAIVLLVMLIMGGFKIMTASGDPKSMESAKKTITMAIAGLLVILFGYLILALIYKFTGVNVTFFRIFVQ